MATRKPVQLSPEALHRIREAARTWPADLGLSDLRRQLSKAIYDYHNWAAAPDDIKIQKARLKAIHKYARDLAGLLRADGENPGLDWCSQWPKDWPPPIKVAEEIQRMIEESSVLKKSPQKIIREIKEDSAVSGSALERLLGSKLPEVFEHCFRRDVTLYQKGDYVRFAMRIIKECEIRNVRPSTIIKALTDARSGRSGRRRGGRK